MILRGTRGSIESWPGRGRREDRRDRPYVRSQEAFRSEVSLNYVVMGPHSKSRKLCTNGCTFSFDVPFVYKGGCGAIHGMESNNAILGLESSHDLGTMFKKTRYLVVTPRGLSVLVSSSAFRIKACI